MIQTLIFARVCLDALFFAARSAVCLSRFLLLIIAVEVVTMPFTQGLWSWDRFLQGGQDFELGLLIIVTCLCLVLLRVQQGQSNNRMIGLIKALFATARNRFANLLLVHRTSFEHRSRIPSPLSHATCSLPLLI